MRYVNEEIRRSSCIWVVVAAFANIQADTICIAQLKEKDTPLKEENWWSTGFPFTLKIFLFHNPITFYRWSYLIRSPCIISNSSGYFFGSVILYQFLWCLEYPVSNRNYKDYVDEKCQLYFGRWEVNISSAWLNVYLLVFIYRIYSSISIFEYKHFSSSYLVTLFNKSYTKNAWLQI